MKLNLFFEEKIMTKLIFFVYKLNEKLKRNTLASNK